MVSEVDRARRVKVNTVWTGKLALAPDKTLTEPLRRRKSTMYFVNSMGDLFHEDCPDEWIDRIFAVMALAPQHTFQVLTKRSARMRAYFALDDTGRADFMYRIDGRCDELVAHSGLLRGAKYDKGESYEPPHWPLPNVWIGVSVEDQTRADERIPDLLATPAVVRFVSYEPALGAVDFRSWLGGQNGDSDSARRSALSWVICGGESGPGARPTAAYILASLDRSIIILMWRCGLLVSARSAPAGCWTASSTTACRRRVDEPIGRRKARVSTRI